jgi:putative membrane protein
LVVRLIFPYFPANPVHQVIQPLNWPEGPKRMFGYILHVLVDAGIIVLLSRVMPQIQVKDFTTAVIVAVLLGLLSFFLGWIIQLPFNLVTLFLLRGIVRIIVTALILKLIDSFLDSFNIQGFWPAIVIAVAVAVVGGIFDGMSPSRSQYRETRTYRQSSQHWVIPTPTRA